MLERELGKITRKKILRISMLCGLISMGISVLSILVNANFVNLFASAVSSLSIGFLTPLIVQLILLGLTASNRIRGIPRIALVLVSALLIMAIITLLTVAILAVLFFLTMGKLPGMEDIKQSLRLALAVGAGISLAVNLYVVLQSYLGEGFFKDLFLGRYALPSQKNAAVAFIDLVGSTGIAERLPPVRFFALLNDFLGVVELASQYTGGKIYKYLGDGVIVVWDLPVRDGLPLKFLTVLEDELTEKSGYFTGRYGETLHCTGGLHAGSVLVGELGNSRKELGYWGDTLNTAQRIQSACKQAGTFGLVSAEALSALSLRESACFGSYRLRRLDGIELRGKKDAVTLYALERS